MKKKKTKVNEKVKGLVLKNFHLLLVADWLEPLMLHGFVARQRNKFVSLLGAKLKEVEKERISNMEKYAERDTDNKMVMIEDGSKVKIREVDREKFNEEYMNLMREEAVFDVLPSNRDVFSAAKDLILNLKREFDFEETKAYEEVCQAFEQI